MYFDVPASQLIFVTESQHAKIHKALKSKAGRAQPREGKARGSKNGCKKGGAISGKKKTGNHWFNNGVEQRHCKECQGEGWVKGRLRKKKEENEE